MYFHTYWIIVCFDHKLSLTVFISLNQISSLTFIVLQMKTMVRIRLAFSQRETKAASKAWPWCMKALPKESFLPPVVTWQPENGAAKCLTIRVQQTDNVGRYHREADCLRYHLWSQPTCNNHATNGAVFISHGYTTWFMVSCSYREICYIGKVKTLSSKSVTFHQKLSRIKRIGGVMRPGITTRWNPKEKHFHRQQIMPYRLLDIISLRVSWLM